MTASGQAGDAAEPKRASADGLLAAPRRPVTRYRPLLIAMAGVVVGAISVAALVIGLSPPRRPVAAQSELREDGAGAADPMEAHLTNGLADYSDPQGPLGAAAATVRQNGPNAGPEPAPQSTQAALNESVADTAARSGPFFSDASLRPPNDGLAQTAPETAAAAQSPGAPQAPAQEQNSPFIAAARATSAALTYTHPQSAFEVKAGAVIPAALLTALNSDLPGEVFAQVTQNVYDSATGRYVLIPQGARLIGRYDSQLAYGQGRALMVWTRIVMPDGRSVDLGGMTGADLSGASGLEDQVNTHIGPLTRAIALSTAITIGGAIAQNAGARSSNGMVLNDAASGLSAQASQVGERFVDRDLNRQPTVQVRQGWPLTVLVSKDLILEPY